MPYPIEQLTPESPDADKQAAIEATMQQMVQEGMNPEEAKAKVMQMAQDILQPMSFPEAQPPTNYGESMRNPNSVFMRGKSKSNGPGQSGWHTVMNDRYTNFNPGFLSDGNVSNK